ncbi:YebC/PmpR family DNA-binding transcriptional regulator [Candidatus Daviesbacteria bacterium]|nr:YebC/PmpR family DNA-binding transcriptional regulator [Candidatus Daviesbacteria bacterium]
MSGHSKWSTIKRQKGAADIKRGQTFTKIANAIIIAVKMGGSGDPGANPRLRMAIEEARSLNMPKENIQRAIDRGLGKGKEALEEVIYEGFGPGKVAFYLEAITDNKLRTLQEVRNLFERSGGSLAGQGSVAYMFEKVGELKVKSKGGSVDEEELQLIDLGIRDVEDFQENNMQRYLVYVESPELNTMSTKITQSGFEVEEASVVMKPNILVETKDPETAKKVLDFAQRLEELDDVQKVYSNFDIPEELI